MMGMRLDSAENELARKPFGAHIPVQEFSLLGGTELEVSGRGQEVTYLTNIIKKALTVSGDWMRMRRGEDP